MLFLANICEAHQWQVLSRGSL